MRMRYAIGMVILVVAGVSASASTLRGRVLSFTTEQGLVGVTVGVYEDGTLIDGAVTLTDEGGVYTIDSLPDSVDLMVKYELEGYDRYPTWENCRLPERGTINVSLFKNPPSRDELRQFFEVLEDSSQGELEAAWKKFAAFGLTAEAQDRIRSEAVGVLGEDAVRRVEMETSVRFGPSNEDSSRLGTMSDAIRVTAVEPSDTEKPPESRFGAQTADDHEIDGDDLEHQRAEIEGNAGDGR